MHVYLLSLDDKGAKLTQTSSPADRAPTKTGDRRGQERLRTFKNNTIADFILGTQSFMGRPLVYATGLTGRYDFTLTWSPDGAAAGSDDAAPELFAAIREQLGLELKAGQAAIPAFTGTKNATTMLIR